MNELPKEVLVRCILNNRDINDIRTYFHIHHDTPVDRRLTEFSKAQLLSYINHVGGRLLNIVNEESNNFPLKAAPTMYIIYTSNPTPINEIEAISLRLRNDLRNAALIFPDDHAVRAIYTRRELRQVRNNPIVFEMGFGYEKRIEITEPDPNSEHYGLSQFIYSLENALIWLPERNRHFAIISCSDFVAIAPIITYLKRYFNLEVALPDLSQDMLLRIARGGQIRNATFSHIPGRTESNLDVNTITIFDRQLQDSRLFQDLRNQRDREQRAGFYSQHPDILRAGIGITRRYGRVWTPAHLNRDELLRLSLGILTNLDTELNEASRGDPSVFTGFYSNVNVNIGQAELTGHSRSTFDILIQYLISANRLEERSVVISREDLRKIIDHKNKLGLVTVAQYECENCGTDIVKCPQCEAIIDCIFERNDIIFRCPSCNNVIVPNEYHCDCGEQCPILDPISHLFIHPTKELLDAISYYLNHLHPVTANPGLFIFIGTRLILLSTQPIQNPQRVYLDVFEKWRIRGRYHTHHPAPTDRLIRILGQLKEKCNINNYHPQEEDCRACELNNLTTRDLDNGKICLLRAFGIPINERFDGIHHGHEGADIIYNDRINNINMRIGIHFKTKSDSNPPRGLGRKNDKIKGLYAQVFYTLYNITRNNGHYDIIGISIPNRISNDVTDSMESILLRFGVSFIALDHDEWIRIISLIRENLQFNNRHNM